MADLWLRDTDRDELVSEIVDKVVESIRREMAPRGPRLVDRHTMATLLSVSEPTLDRIVRSGKIPSKLVGSRRLFNPDDVIAALPDQY